MKNITKDFIHFLYLNVECKSTARVYPLKEKEKMRSYGFIHVAFFFN